jgi:hypothetical protein
MSSYAPNAGDFRKLALRQVVVRSVTALVFAGGLAACSAMPEWSKPAAVYGDTAASPTPAGTKGFPELADTPDKKPASTSAADQKAIAESLSEDRVQSRDGDKALRKGAAPSSAVTPPAKLNADEQSAMNARPDTGLDAPVQQAKAAAPAAPAKPAVTPVPAQQAEAPAPVAAPAPAATPAPVKQAAAPAPVPVKQAEAPVVAPVVAPESTRPAAPVVAPAVAAKAETPASPAVEDAPATTASTLEPGVIPMPPRGGHKTFAEVRAQAKAADEAEAASLDDDAVERGESEIEESQQPKAAPTKPVDVSPMPDNL